MLINHIFNFHKKKNNGRQNYFWTVKNRVLENVIHVSYIQIPCSYNMYFEKKKTFQTPEQMVEGNYMYIQY